MISGLFLLGLTELLCRAPLPQPPLTDPYQAGFFGIRMEARDNSAYITWVAEDGPATSAGLLVGDKIIEVLGNKISSDEDLRAILPQLRPGTIVTLQAKRENKTQTFKLRVGGRPEV
jgi:S1-C subfamily serine protease